MKAVHANLPIPNVIKHVDFDIDLVVLIPMGLRLYSSTMKLKFHQVYMTITLRRNATFGLPLRSIGQRLGFFFHKTLRWECAAIIPPQYTETTLTGIFHH